MTHTDAALAHYQAYLNSDDFNTEFLVSRRDELARVISTLVRSRELITVYLCGSDVFYLSAILGLDTKSGRIYLDMSNQQHINQQVESATQGLMVYARPNDIRTLIYLEQPVLAHYQGSEAFAVPVPTHMVRLQRREYIRVNPSADDALNCTIHVEHRTLSASIQDISEGGLSLTTSHLPEGLQIGDIMPECTFTLPGEDRIEYDLKIRRISRNEEDAPFITYSLGCEYVNPKAISNARLRQYIWQQERSNRAAEKS